jgi:hypothetical protein
MTPEVNMSSTSNSSTGPVLGLDEKAPRGFEKGETIVPGHARTSSRVRVINGVEYLVDSRGNLFPADGVVTYHAVQLHPMPFEAASPLEEITKRVLTTGR